MRRFQFFSSAKRSTGHAIALSLCALILNCNDVRAQSESGFGPGVQSITVTQQVSHGYYAGTPTPYCIGNTNVYDLVNSVASFLSDTNNPSFLGPLLSIINRYHNEIRGGIQLQGWANEVLTGIYGDESARCNPLVVVLPAGSQYVGFRYDAFESDGSGAACGKDGNGWYVCGIGYSKFPSEPVTTGAGNSLLVTGLFMNWSHDRNRLASMTVFFRPPAWWNQ